MQHQETNKSQSHLDVIEILLYVPANILFV